MRGGGTKNLRISNSYVDIRISSPYNTTTNTTSMMYTNSVGSTTTNTTSNVGYCETTTTIYKTSYNYNYDSSLTITDNDPLGGRDITYERRGYGQTYTTRLYFSSTNGGIYDVYTVSATRNPYKPETYYVIRLDSYRMIGSTATTKRTGPYASQVGVRYTWVYSGNSYFTSATEILTYTQIISTTTINTTSKFYYYDVQNTTTNTTSYSYY